MKKRIPKKVNILGHDYKVVWVAQKTLGEFAAICEFPTRFIRISKEVRGTDLGWHYFLHECWHAVQFERGDMQYLSHQSMESHADSFSSFVQTLQKQKII